MLGVGRLMLEGLFREKAKGNLKTSTGGVKPRPLQISAKAVDTRQELAKIAGALLDAEVRIGQLFKAMPKAKNQHESASNTGVTSTTTKQETIENLGFNKMQASRFETLAEHPERF